MNKKQIVFLGVLFIALALGLALKHLVKSADRVVAREVYSPLSFSFDPAKVERILINRSAIQTGKGFEASSVDLVKQGGRWSVKNLWGAKADEEKVKNLLDAVRNAKGELRSSEKALFNDFGISDRDAISLKFTAAADAPVLDLRIGVKKAGYGGFFARKAGSAEVYFVDAPFDELLGIFVPMEEAKLAPDFWADLALFSLKPDEVTKITVSRLKNGAVESTAGVERLDPKDAPPGGGWKLSGPQQAMPVDNDKVLRFIATMNSVKAQSVADPAGEGYGLQKPVWRLAVAEGNKETVLEAGPLGAKDGVYFVKLNTLPQVFRLAADYFEDLDVKKDEQFLKEAPKAPGAETSPRT